MARHRGQKWGARDLGMPGRKTWEREARKRLAAKRKNPWTHGVLGLGRPGQACATSAGAIANREAERDRYNYLKDAVAIAKAGASLREIVALTHAAARIRKLTKEEAMRVVFARRLGQEQVRNPRGWTWAHAKARAARRGRRKARRANPNVDIVSYFRQVREAQRAVGRHSDLWRGLPPAPTRRRRKVKRANPGDRPRVLWFLVAGQHWITATARGVESVRDALYRSYLADTGFAKTNLQVTKPDGFTPGEWLGVIAKHAVYKPQHTNPKPKSGDDEQAEFARMPLAEAKRLVAEYQERQKSGCFSAHLSKKRVGGTFGSLCDINPPRDPIYVGVFALGHEPKKTGGFADGDVAVVESPYKTRMPLDRPYEVWVFGTIDPRQGDAWHYASGPMSRSDAIEEAKRLARL